MKRIPLRNRAGEVVAEALVDDADYEWLLRWRWHRQSRGYAARAIGPVDRRRLVLMHRQILGLDCGDIREADHINRNRLDNRRANLRVVHSRSEQMQNQGGRSATSRYRGVSWNRARRKWIATGWRHGKHVHIGSFLDEGEAARAAADFRREHMPFATN